MYSIKLVQEKDIDKLSEVFSKSFTDADKEKPWDFLHSKEYLTYWLKKRPDMFYGAFDEANNPIGAMAVNIKPWRTGTRCSDGVVFVDIQHQKQGIAKSLFKEVVGKAMNKYNAESFEAITFAGKEFPLAWYTKIGIKPDDGAVLIKGNCKDILNNLS